jgi:putative thioredoxin
VLSRVPGNFATDGLAARIELQQDPDSPSEPLGDAFRALDAGDTERGLQLLIGALASADGKRDPIRRVVVGVLDELGVDDPLARESRRKLASALY